MGREARRSMAAARQSVELSGKRRSQRGVRGEFGLKDVLIMMCCKHSVDKRLKNTVYQNS